jgi:Na+/H+ antiporter NhaA
VSEPDAADTAGRTAWTRTLQTPFRSFIQTETGGASVLLGAAIAALLWVNVDASSYDSLWHTALSIRLGSGSVDQDLRGWVNSGLMTFFFFVVGLEARREADIGELRETSARNPSAALGDRRHGPPDRHLPGIQRG